MKSSWFYIREPTERRERIYASYFESIMSSGKTTGNFGQGTYDLFAHLKRRDATNLTSKCQEIFQTSKFYHLISQQSTWMPFSLSRISIYWIHARTNILWYTVFFNFVIFQVSYGGWEEISWPIHWSTAVLYYSAFQTKHYSISIKKEKSLYPFPQFHYFYIRISLSESELKAFPNRRLLVSPAQHAGSWPFSSAGRSTASSDLQGVTDQQSILF